MERRFTKHAKAKIEKREGKSPVISGVGAVYYDGTPDTEYQLWDGFRERIMPGAFDRALKEGDDVRGLFNHDPSMVLGRTASGTMKLATDSVGLHYEIQPGDTTVGRDVAVHLDRGDVTGSSFSFSVSDQRFVMEDGVEFREITGFSAVFDTGPVTYPAYESTTAGIRAAGDVTEARAAYDAWKNGLESEHTRAMIDQTRKIV